MGKALLKGGQCCLSCFSCLLSYFKLKSLSGGLRTGVLWEFGVLLTQEVCKLQKRNASRCELELVTPRTGSAKDPQRGLLSLMNLSGCEPGLGGFNFYFNFLLFMYFLAALAACRSSQARDHTRATAVTAWILSAWVPVAQPARASLV